MSRKRQLPRDAAGGVRSLGRRLLNVALERTTQRELARDISRIVGRTISQGRISELASGKYVSDSYSLRMAFHRRIGIPPGAWDEPDPGVIHDDRAA